MKAIQILLKRYKFLSTAFVLIFAGAFTACDVNDDNEGMGSMRVLLTDAPAIYDEVNIDVRQVLVNQSADEELDDDGANGWEVIYDDSMRVNLLDYRHGETLELGESELETGRYNQLRLVLGDNNDVVIDGETHALNTPSAQQSGYKLNIQANVEEGEVYELVIDFDASQSIVETGNNRFNLHPVLRTVDLQQSGSISGTVLPAEAEPIVFAIMDEDTVGTIPDEEGDFRIIGLSEGTYEVYFNPAIEDFADSLVTGVVIVEAEEFTFEESIVLENVVIQN
ncbi:MAG: DUF4382 domain-containing protein [Balneolaceae bacterium]